jgi:hypothetical protein
MMSPRPSLRRTFDEGLGGYLNNEGTSSSNDDDMIEIWSNIAEIKSAPAKDPMRQTVKTCITKAANLSPMNEREKARERVRKHRRKEAERKANDKAKREFLLEDNIQREASITGLQTEMRSFMAILAAHQQAQPGQAVFHQQNWV